MRNECELEEARCEGKSLYRASVFFIFFENNLILFIGLNVVDSIQCFNFTAGQLRNCSCPNMGTCNTQSPRVCAISARNQCKLMLNNCELEKAKCKGEGKFHYFLNMFLFI